jgi:hypothetical protein
LYKSTLTRFAHISWCSSSFIVVTEIFLFLL